MTIQPREGLPAAWDALGAEAWARHLGLPRIEVHAELASTNDRARELALRGAATFTTVVAGSQTRGRGRGGASWHSPAGMGLWISVLLPFRAEEASAPLSLAVGVATARAVERAAGIAVQLKWPNDILRGGRKVAGILCETVGEAEGRAVAGIGVNLRRAGREAPSHLEARAGFLEEIAAREIAEPDLASALVDELRAWADPAPRVVDGALRAEWETRDCLRGRPVVAEGGAVGICAGVREDGALELSLADGSVVAVRSGRVRLMERGASPALYRNGD